MTKGSDVPCPAGPPHHRLSSTWLGARKGDRRAPTLVGLAPADVDVALVVAGAGVQHGAVVRARVQTKQIAPTILSLLGLRPRALEAVRREHTRTLPRPRG